MYVRPLSNVSSVSRTQLIDFHVHCLSVGFTLDVTILRDDVVLICKLNHIYIVDDSTLPHANSYNRLLK